jgi:hypothetical protein
LSTIFYTIIKWQEKKKSFPPLPLFGDVTIHETGTRLTQEGNGEWWKPQLGPDTVPQARRAGKRGRVTDTGREWEVKKTWQSEPVSENKMILGRWCSLSPNP